MSLLNSLQTSLGDTAMTWRGPTWDVEAALRDLEESQDTGEAPRNKVAILTGGSAGIGTEIFKGLARVCERVYIFGRSPSRNQAAIDALPTVQQRARCTSVECDLSSLESIRKSAGVFFALEKEKLGVDQADKVHVDVFVGNAGLLNYATKERTKDGWESMWGTNALGHHALIHHLLPAINSPSRTSEAPRIVILASGAHSIIYSADSNFYPLKERLASDVGKGSFPLYGRSKAANILDQRGWVRYFTEQPQTGGAKPIVVSVHPGAIRSLLARSHESVPLLRFARIMIHKLVCWPASPYGATNAIWAALFATPEEVDGKYVQPWCDTRMEPTALARDERLGREHWEFMEELVRDEDEGRGTRGRATAA